MTKLSDNLNYDFRFTILEWAKLVIKNQKPENFFTGFWLNDVKYVSSEHRASIYVIVALMQKLLGQQQLVKW